MTGFWHCDGTLSQRATDSIKAPARFAYAILTVPPFIYFYIVCYSFIYIYIFFLSIYFYIVTIRSLIELIRSLRENIRSVIGHS